MNEKPKVTNMNQFIKLLLMIVVTGILIGTTTLVFLSILLSL